MAIELGTYFVFSVDNRAARKAFAIGLFLMFLHEFCGCFTMINYTATIFSESGSSIAPKLAAIVVAAIQLVGTLVSTQLVDRAGRKVTAAAAMRRGALIVCFFLSSAFQFLLIGSLIGSGVSLVTLATYSYMNVLGYNVKPYSWVAVSSFSAMLFLASCGIIPLPFVVLAEIMPERVK